MTEAEIRLIREAERALKERRAKRAAKASDKQKPTHIILRMGKRSLGGGRLSVDQSSESKTLAANFLISAPTSWDEDWRADELDSKTLSRISATELMERLTNLSPEISRALWDFLRFCNPGYEISANKPGTDETDEDAQAALDEFLGKLKTMHGALDVLFGKLFFGAFLRGAFFAELILNEEGDEPIDIATPDPESVRFKKETDAERGVYWQLGQYVDAEFKSLDRETIGYVPVDPMPGHEPYGRPIATPALFSMLFLLSLLHDLKRVVAQQGYPRLDIEINMERLLASMPDGIGDDPEQVRAWIQDTIDEVEDVYEELEPDDAYIHPDTITVNRPVGTVDSSSLGAVDALIRAIERMATRALKTMPLLMGSNESTTETHANRQWEIHVAGIKSLQHLCENLLGRLFTLALECQGIQAQVKLRFAELRDSERLRDAQAQQMEIKNVREKYNAGWISQEEAADSIVEHPPDVERPRDALEEGLTFSNFGTLDGEEADIERARAARAKLNIRRGQRVTITPEGASDPLPEVPAEAEVSDTDIERAVSEWDAAMPDYENLLSADVEGQEEFDEDVLRIIVGFWVWNQMRKRYKHTETEEVVSGRKLTSLRDEFTLIRTDLAQDLTKRLASGELTIQEWELEMRRKLKETYFDQYALGKGGRNNIIGADRRTISRLLNVQNEFLHGFASDISNGQLSEAQIRARSEMYFNSSTQAFEIGKVTSYDRALVLPQYPGDGATPCLTNCKCEWIIREEDELWLCTWKLNATAEHCSGCQSNAARWNPLQVSKTRARDRRQLESYLSKLSQHEGHH